MFGRRHPKIDWSFSKRRQAHSNTSSASLSSPTGPELESPITFQAMAINTSPEATMKKNKKMDRAPVVPSVFLEKDDDEPEVPTLTHGVSNDARTVYVAHKSVEEEAATKTKSQYYEEAFNTRGPYNSPTTRVTQDSIIVVEIKMSSNVKDDESKLVADISFRLAQIYQRPESSMMVTLQQDACLNLGTSPLPAYLMKVFALPCLIAPVTNLRNTILIQTALQEHIHIAPNRGVVLYIPVPEENFATNGVTLMGEIARLERRSQNEEPGILKTISRSMSRRLKSSSDNSAPMSVATSSSYVQGTGTPGSESKKDPRSGGTSLDEGEPRSVRKSRSLRHFVSRRLSELGAVGDPH
ncbi:hypothetical protein ASPWEDRAFT_477100 [Aspergillus wentii DTO 134E9]|uniref:L-dopachrome isomerase n=1 Tax=Aspergillus wentii DTO 134E9 TaxID=1073089 RepID=A0A1L9RIP5_ASPWE|nr:uncharacterized protein ASPWEDRAFT_477100 [Aspergillus wentii DTO 134E9]OJJ34794.1 hypothetical protein ASPWEDRAFT_477100 [Aspergillus wentii DTO 134E9]